MSTWECIHLFAGDDGLSRLVTDHAIDLTSQDFAPPATPMLVSRAPEPKALAFIELPVGWHGGWHPSPTPQWVICLAGEMGYEAGDGSRFTLRPGTCILTTDTQGKGHDSWNAGDEPVKLALIGI